MHDCYVLKNQKSNIKPPNKDLLHCPTMKLSFFHIPLFFLASTSAAAVFGSRQDKGEAHHVTLQQGYPKVTSNQRKVVFKYDFSGGKINPKFFAVDLRQKDCQTESESFLADFTTNNNELTLEIGAIVLKRGITTLDVCVRVDYTLVDSEGLATSVSHHDILVNLDVSSNKDDPWYSIGTIATARYGNTMGTDDHVSKNENIFDLANDGKINVLADMIHVLGETHTGQTRSTNLNALLYGAAALLILAAGVISALAGLGRRENSAEHGAASRLVRKRGRGRGNCIVSLEEIA
jgi:hypothetical protein